MTRIRVVVIVAGLALFAASLAVRLVRHDARPAAQRAELSVADALGGGDTAGFARVTGPRVFTFPADHGAHPAYRTEWWYFTGNVRTADGRRFGYQLTLFRNALAAAPPGLDSEWSTNQVWMGHLGVSDASARRFHGFERFARGAAGLAGATVPPLRVWLEDWSVTGAGAAGWAGIFPVRLRAVDGGTGVDLVVEPAKALVLQGDAGYSRKGADRANASHYYSFTRLVTRGSIFVGGDRHDVEGVSWLDREWSTSALDDGQAGWDWFALQFDDGTELMYYQLRRQDGSPDVHSRGAFVHPDGTSSAVLRDDVQLNVLAAWDSPRGGRYPSRWRVRVDSLDLDVIVEPVFADQEHDTYVRYWEGAVDVRGDRGGTGVTGVGFVELTGYADDALRR